MILEELDVDERGLQSVTALHLHHVVGDHGVLEGRRVVNGAVEAWQDDRARPIASANAHFLISPRNSEE